MTALRADHESIHIPADPEQNVVERSFQISSAATAAVLPPEGIQVFGARSHMHGAGVRAVAKLIRNGVHIKNVWYENRFDFALQNPVKNVWRMMPGDSIIVSCFYRPEPDRDIVGGLEFTDEMCNLYIGSWPMVEGFEVVTGLMVGPDEPFKNSYMGYRNGYETASPGQLKYKDAIYPPDGRDFVPLAEHELDVCDLMVRNELINYTISFCGWADPSTDLYDSILRLCECPPSGLEANWPDARSASQEEQHPVYLQTFLRHHCVSHRFDDID